MGSRQIFLQVSKFSLGNYWTQADCKETNQLPYFYKQHYILIYRNSTLLLYDVCSWHSTPKTPEISQVIGVALLLRSPLQHSWVCAKKDSSGWGLVTRKTNHVIVQSRLWASPNSRELKIEWNPNKTPSGASWLGTHYCDRWRRHWIHGGRALEALCSGSSQDLTQCVSSFSWFQPVSLITKLQS